VDNLGTRGCLSLSLSPLLETRLDLSLRWTGRHARTSHCAWYLMRNIFLSLIAHGTLLRVSVASSGTRKGAQSAELPCGCVPSPPDDFPNPARLCIDVSLSREHKRAASCRQPRLVLIAFADLEVQTPHPCLRSDVQTCRASGSSCASTQRRATWPSRPEVTQANEAPSLRRCIEFFMDHVLSTSRVRRLRLLGGATRDGSTAESVAKEPESQPVRKARSASTDSA
jgi:hypothetical protein